MTAEKPEDFFAALDRQYHLGISSVARLSGGFLHKMYAVDTKRGKYAVKLLNPSIMARPDAMANFRRAEELEELLVSRGIPVLPVRVMEKKSLRQVEPIFAGGELLLFGGLYADSGDRTAGKMQELGGQYFYVFDFYEGKALSPEEVTPAHCEKMGRVLASIHAICKRVTDEIPPETHIDWEGYLAPLREDKPELYRSFADALPLLRESEERGNRAKKKLPRVRAICHNDMDCKNVLWRGEDFRVIDLECLNWGNPFLECWEQALTWAGYTELSFDPDRFAAFLSGYRKAGGDFPPVGAGEEECAVLFDSNNGRLDWLAYNLDRALGRVSCTVEEAAVGESEAQATIAQAVYYESLRGGTGERGNALF